MRKTEYGTLLSIDEAAKQIGVSPATVRRLIAQEEFNPEELDGQTLLYADEVAMAARVRSVRDARRGHDRALPVPRILPLPFRLMPHAFRLADVSRLWFRWQDLAALKNRPEYQEYRQRYENARGGKRFWPEPFVTPGWPWHELEPVNPREPSAATRKDHGLYLTTRQVALRLGVAVTTVRRMRAEGRLTGCRRPKHKSHDYTWHQRWYFKKEEVEALELDSGYVEQRRRYERGRRKKLDKLHGGEEGAAFEERGA